MNTSENGITRFKSVTDYLPAAKPGDRLVFGGHGIVDGMGKMWFKEDTFKLSSASTENLVLTAYRGRNSKVLPASKFNQEMAVLTPKAFQSLKSIY